MTTAVDVPNARPLSGVRTGGARAYGWMGVAAAAGIALLGLISGITMLMLAGLAVAGLLAVLLAPELALALFLVAGGIKKNPALSGFPVDLTFAAALLVLIAIGAKLLQERDLPRLPPATALFVALAALIAVSVMWTRNINVGMSKATTFQTLTAIAFFAPFFLLRTRSELIRAMLGVVAAGMFVALTAVSTGDPSQPLVAAGGNEIELGLYSAFGLVAAVGYLMLLGPSLLRLFWIVPGVVLGTTILGAGSRGAVAGSALALVFVAVSRAISSRRGRRIVLVALAAGIGVFVVAPNVAGLAAKKYENQLFSTNTQRVLGDRGYLYDTASTLALNHPLGVGAGGFDPDSDTLYPHNILLELASEEGLLGVALMTALIVAAWRARRRVQKGALSPEATLAGALLVLTLVEAFVSFDLNENRLMWFSLGLALAIPRLRPDL